MTEIHAHLPARQSGTPTTATTTLPWRAANAIAIAKTKAARRTPAVTQEALDLVLGEHLPELRTTVNGKLELHVDEASGRVVGRVIDRETGDLIRQIPTDKMLRLIARTKELLGSIYDASI